MKNKFETLNIFTEDKPIFSKLSSDWNVLNPTRKRNKAEFFRMMMNKFREQLKKEISSLKE